MTGSDAPPAAGADAELAIIVPVYNDWACVARLLEELAAALRARRAPVHLLLVDDGSTDRAELAAAPSAFASTKRLRLRCNVGHQRAIAVGLTWALQGFPSVDRFVIMDADGEDRPADLLRLLEAFEAQPERAAVFAERRRRMTGWRFAAAYRLFQLLHWVLTGRAIRVGNFSVLPREQAEALVASGHLWSHYAATVVRLRLPRLLVPADRGVRYSGQGKMGFASLVRHGLSALSVYSDLIGVRVLLASALLGLVALALLATIVLVRLTTDLAVPGWATYTGGLVLVLLLQVVTLAFSFTVHSLADTGSSSFIPMRDCRHFLLAVEDLRRC